MNILLLNKLRDAQGAYLSLETLGLDAQAVDQDLNALVIDRRVLLEPGHLHLLGEVRVAGERQIFFVCDPPHRRGRLDPIQSPAGAIDRAGGAEVARRRSRERSASRQSSG